MPEIQTRSTLRLRVLAAVGSLLIVGSLGAPIPVAVAGGGSTRYVGSCGSPTYGTIALAVAAAASGDTIHICGGAAMSPVTYSLSATVTVTQGSLMFEGDGASATIVDGGSALQLFASGVGNTALAFNRLTLRNGSSENGGAIGARGSVAVTDSTFTHNTATTGSGGAIWASGRVTATSAMFNGNTAPSGSGGAISAVSNVTVDATGGTGSTFTGNAAGADGGAISAAGSVTATRATFSANSATASGGAIRAATATVTASTFDANSATVDGGAIHGSSGVSVTNSTFDANSATASGGAIKGSSTLTNSTFVDNATGTGTGTGTGTRAASAAGAGGAVDGETVSATNTIFAQLTASSANCSATIADGGGNFSTDDSCHFTALTSHNWVVVATLHLGLLAANGGPTRTIALLAGSPAIGAGVSSVCQAAPVNGVDQRGVARPSAERSCSSGAYEYVAAPTVTFISPSTGPIAGGTEVTIRGTGFVDGATVSFGGKSSSLTVVDASTGTATTPGHASGAVDVAVTNPDTLPGTLARGFTYFGTAVGIVLSGSTADLASGAPRILTATIVDAAGNTVTADADDAEDADSTAVVTFAVSDQTTGTGTVMGLDDATATAGVAVLEVSGAHAGLIGLQASATLHDDDITSNVLTFVVTPGMADKLAFTQAPSGGAHGVAWTTQPWVAVKDAAGNTVVDSTASITLAITTPGGAILTCAQASNTRNAVAGVAKFTGCAIDKVGTAYTLTATATGFTPPLSTPAVTSPAFNITAGAADATESTLTPTTASIVANGVTTQVLTVQAKDAGRNELWTGGAVVTITKLSDAGTISESVTDNHDGTYTALVTSPTAAGSGVFVATLDHNPVKSGGLDQTQATITYTASSANAINAFGFTSPAATGVVNEGTHTIAVTVPLGTNVTALVPTIAVSPGASVSPLSGAATNFTNPVTYTVTAGAATQPYVVTVTRAPAGPTISDFDPAEGDVGTEVAITGKGFTDATRVEFVHDWATTFTVDSDTEITATVPRGARTGRIAVTTPGGTAVSTKDFTVTMPSPDEPTVESLFPAWGPTPGGTLVRFTGTGFVVGQTAVHFGPTVAQSITIIDATTGTAVSPGGFVAVHVTVTTPAGTSDTSEGDLFTYFVLPLWAPIPPRPPVKPVPPPFIPPGEAPFTPGATPTPTPTSTTAPTSRLTLLPATTTVTWGDPVTLTATLDPGGVGRPIVFERSTDGLVTWAPIGTATTEADGTAGLTFSPQKNARYRARFAGAVDLAAATSAVVSVLVRQTVGLRPIAAMNARP